MNLIETGHHEVNASGDPDLGTNGVVTGAVKDLNSKILFDPFEEELDLPTTLVNGGDGQCGQGKIVRKECQAFLRLRIDKRNTAKAFRVIPLSLCGSQYYDLIAPEAGGFVNDARLAHGESGIRFASYNEESARHMDTKEAPEIQVGTIKNIDTSNLKDHTIEEVYVMYRSFGNADKHWNRACKVDLCMQLNRRLSPSKICPRKNCETQVDSRRIHSINHLIYIQSVRLVNVQLSSLTNEDMAERFIDSPIPELICVGKVGSGDVTPDAHNITMLTVAQTSFDIAQTLSKSNLRKGHRKELIAGAHTSAPSRHRVTGNATFKLFAVEHIHNLGENQTAFVHEASLNKPLRKAIPSFKCVTPKCRRYLL